MSEERLMTYAEAATALGKSPEAVRQLAKRRRWRRAISNEDGLARVSIPVEYIAANPPDERGPDERTAPEQPQTVQPDAHEGSTGNARALLAMLEARVSEMSGELKEARADLRQAHATIADLSAKAARAEGLEALLVTERERIADLRAERDRTLADKTTAQPKPRSWLSRLLRVG